MDNLLWPEEEIKISTDGFLLIADPEKYLLDEEQPLLLHTTDALLRALYPSLEIHETFSRCGFEPEEKFGDHLDGTEIRSQSTSEGELESVSTENGHVLANTGRISTLVEYEKYQTLIRIENLPNQIHLALQDIRNFRHRINGSRSDSRREYGKIRALELQQNHLIRVNSETNGGNFDIEGKNGTTRNDQGGHQMKSEVGVAGDGGGNDADNVRLEEESILVKLARTINSIRALFPHLLPILNHPRQNDKNLVIGKIRYKTKRNGPMCWLLGAESFSSCTLKQITAAQEDTKQILEAFIDTESASEISKDLEGSPSYWSISWIEHIVKRSSPALLSPVKVLTNISSISEEDVGIRARDCDTKIYDREKASSQGLDQQYRRAVRKIHQRLSNVLTSRFHGARVSIGIVFVGLFLLF